MRNTKVRALEDPGTQRAGGKRTASKAREEAKRREQNQVKDKERSQQETEHGHQFLREHAERESLRNITRWAQVWV